MIGEPREVAIITKADEDHTHHFDPKVQDAFVELEDEFRLPVTTGIVRPHRGHFPSFNLY